jgi:hypothetical protein
MSFKKEQSLQLKVFEGVDRFVEGTARPSTSFDKIQNMHVPNPGELKSLAGVTKLTGAAIPGVSEFKHIKFIDHGSFERVLMAMYTPSVSSIPVPATVSGDITTSGGSGSSRDILIMFVGPGGSYAYKIISAFSVEANGITVPVPSNVPDYISCVHVFIQDASSNYIWSGSFTRKDNVFPATIACPRPGAQVTNYTSGSTERNIVYSANAIRLVSSYTSGSLEGGRGYFFKVGAWVAGKSTRDTSKTGRYVEMQYRTENLASLSIYLPEGKSSANVIIDYLPYDIVTAANPATVDVAYTHAIVACGLGEEDGLPIGDDLNDGTALPIECSNTTASIDNVDTTNNTFRVPSYNIPVGSFLKLTGTTAPTTSPAGDLVLNSFYYVKTSSYDPVNNRSTVTLSKTSGGATIDVTSTGTSINFAWKYVDFTLKHLPQNSDMCPIVDAYGDDQLLTGVSSSGDVRDLLMPTWHGVTSSSISYDGVSSTSRNPSGLGCTILKSIPHAPEDRREVLVNFRHQSFTTEGHTESSHVLSEFIIDQDSAIQSRQYGDRLFMVNGFNTPFYTDGYVIKPITVNYRAGTIQVYAPITKYIEFYKDQMCLAGGSTNAVYSSGNVYISNTGAGIYDFENGTTGRPYILPVKGSDGSEIRGLNVYSQDLSTTGPASFLAIGKQFSVFTWDGNLQTLQAQQIAKSAGWAGPNCYVLTKFGPIFLSRDNVYYFESSSNVTPIGDQIKDIIKDIPEDELENIFMIYHDEDVKIGYKVDDSLDREIWLRIRQEQGALKLAWSGPHVMKEYDGCAVINTFGGEREVRVSFHEGDLFRRDDPGSYLNNGLNIQRSISLRNLGLQADHVLKLINRMAIHMRLTQDEDFDLTLESEDGSTSIVLSSTAELLGYNRQLKQFWIPQRFLARVLHMSLENNSDGDLSIYDISAIYSIIKRRVLP